MPWSPDDYLKFGDERTRPAVELAARVDVATPRRVIDLGCGPGNSTRVLRQRWPDADVDGLDSSPTMIAAAKATDPGGRWTLADIGGWQASRPYDVIFSNAALQWVSGHAMLVRHLLAQLAPGGALAFQIPSRSYSRIRAAIEDIADDPAWKARLAAAREALTMEEAAVYYDALAPSARSVDIWQTEYQHVMPTTDAIVDWIASTGLRPFIDALESTDDRARFVTMLRARAAADYAVRSDGRVLFPFARLFVIAYA